MDDKIVLAIDTSCDPPSPKGYGRASETLPLILAIDTSCDETSASVTQGTRILSNVVWSQASEHAKFGGVMPSLAQRMHNERIDWVIQRALRSARCFENEIDAVAVTSGPGLAIALEVGIRKAKELAFKWNVPLIEVNHIEGHLLSSLARPSTSPTLRGSSSPNPGEDNEEGMGVTFPALGLVVSGGHTELIYIEEVGKYKIIASTQDDALGEALDKAARMLGLGYPGGAFLEKLARDGNPPLASSKFCLPLPMAGREDLNKFSYSGLKTAMYRLVSTQEASSVQVTKDLASAFQDMAFKHLVRVLTNSIKKLDTQRQVNSLLVGGGVAANNELRKRLRKLGTELGFAVYFPASKKLCGDNAGMIGVAAGFKIRDLRFEKEKVDKVDRKPRWKVDEKES